MISRTRLLFCLAALAAGILAYFAGRSMPAPNQRSGILLDELAELDWLRAELNLSTAQMEAVAKVHHDYRPRCEEMCAKIRTAESIVARLAARPEGMTPELSRAIENAATVRAECQAAMLGHLHATAALLEPDQADRYLRAMVPLALGTHAPENHDSHGHAAGEHP